MPPAQTTKPSVVVWQGAGPGLQGPGTSQPESELLTALTISTQLVGGVQLGGVFLGQGPHFRTQGRGWEVGAAGGRGVPVMWQGREQVMRMQQGEP